MIELAQELGGDVILALILGEGQHGDALSIDEGFDRANERLADRCQQGRGSERLTAMIAEKVDHALLALELGDVDVEVHAIDAFNFQRHVFCEDFGDGTW